MKTIREWNLAKVLTVAMAVAPVVAQYRPVAAAAQQPSSVEAAADAEGHLMTYTVSPDSVMRPVVDAFEKEHPKIKVEWLRIPSTQLLSRFMGELQSGVIHADLLMPASSELFQQKPELFVKLTTANIPNLARVTRVKAVNDSYALVEVVYHVISYNTDLVSPDDLKNHLRSWKDLIDPRWHDKIGMPDPKVTTSNVSWLKLMRETYGDDWLRAFGRSGITVVGTGTLAVQQMAVGAFEITVPALIPQTAGPVSQGAPIGVLMPDGPAHGIGNGMAIPKGAPHPDAALVFANWSLSPEAQAISCSSGAAVPVVAVDPGAKCGQISPNHVTALDLIPEETERQLLGLIGLKD